MPVPRSILHQHQYHSQRLRRHRLQQQSHGRIGNRDGFLHGAVGLVPVGSHRLIIVMHDAAGAGSLRSLVADPDLPSGVMKGDGLSPLAVNAFHGRLVRSAAGAPPFPGLVELVVGADPNRGAHAADLPGHRVLRMVHRYPDKRERERRDCHTGAPLLGRYFQCKVWSADGSKVPRRCPYHLLPLPPAHGAVFRSQSKGDEHCLKSNITELRSHKVSWRIQPRNGRIGHRRRKDSLQRIGEPGLGFRHAGHPSY